MADTTTEIDLDSVIDRLLEGELACCIFVIVVAQNAIGAEWVQRGLEERRVLLEVGCCRGGRSNTP
jgi:hypothetical protein